LARSIQSACVTGQRSQRTRITSAPKANSVDTSPFSTGTRFGDHGPTGFQAGTSHYASHSISTTHYHPPIHLLNSVSHYCCGSRFVPSLQVNRYVDAPFRSLSEEREYRFESDRKASLANRTFHAGPVVSPGHEHMVDETHILRASCRCLPRTASTHLDHIHTRRFVMVIELGKVAEVTKGTYPNGFIDMVVRRYTPN
jgi:hypothetical protein